MHTRTIFVIGLIVLLNTISGGLSAQILDDSLFRIYRSEFVFGAITQIRFDFDGSYEISVTEIHCSLCDHDQLKASINSKGQWKQKSDTIILENRNMLLVVGDSIIRPLYVIGLTTDSLSDSQKNQVKKKIINSTNNDFHLVYDTYPNGVARLVVDRYRLRRNEYEIKFNADGSIKSVKYYRDDKQRRKIK